MNAVPQDPQPNTQTSSSEIPFSTNELKICLRVLEAIVEDRAILASLSDDERRMLLTAAGKASRPESHKERRLVKEFRRSSRQEKRNRDKRALAATEIRVAREAPVFTAPAPILATPKLSAPRVLQKPRNCYICKAEYNTLHFFYDSMCQTCAEFNYAKRFQTADLRGRVALITGARVKIGFQAALMMLRAGASVIVSTRFPHDAAQRYTREADFNEWKDRLQIHGLDLRHAPSVEIFTRFFNQTYERLDILINNAAQTVRRPPGFYAHMLPLETQPCARLPPEMQAILRQHENCKAALEVPAALQSGESGAGDTGLTAWQNASAMSGANGIGLRASARLSQVPYAFDKDQGMDVFPLGKTDADLQQVDLRTQNSWRLTLGEVPTPEMMEVQLVNSIAPFILCSKLKPLMLRHPTGEKHIVNVSAMEGVFSRGTKTDKHPHTNMAKAALNMMTLTSARDYVQDGIHMNAVDTGWVTDEDPAIHAARKRQEHDFQPPLDIVDGAARICDPFFSGLLTGEHIWGKFLKDYKPCNW